MGICISIASFEIHDEDLTIFEARKVLNGSQSLCSVYSRQGTKGINQDAASIHEGYGMEDGVFCGVYDGHGRNGHIVSKMVNSTLPSLILDQKKVVGKVDAIENGDTTSPKYHVNTKSFQKWKEAIVSAFKVMDKEVKLQQNVDFGSSGTTAVVIIKQGEGLVIANLGDSRAVLGTIYDEKLVAIQLTTDLKPGLPRSNPDREKHLSREINFLNGSETKGKYIIRDAEEAERIRRSNGCVYALKEEPHIQRVWIPNDENSPGLAMSRAFGDFLLKDHGLIAIPDISYHSLTSSDQFVVLASDGVWDVLSNSEVASIVWSVESEEAAARAVVEAANAAWQNKYPSSRRDDCTVVCLFLQNKPQFWAYQNSNYVSAP